MNVRMLILSPLSALTRLLSIIFSFISAQHKLPSNTIFFFARPHAHHFPKLENEKTMLCHRRTRKKKYGKFHTRKWFSIINFFFCTDKFPSFPCRVLHVQFIYLISLMRFLSGAIFLSVALSLSLLLSSISSIDIYGYESDVQRRFIVSTHKIDQIKIDDSNNASGQISAHNFFFDANGISWGRQLNEQQWKYCLICSGAVAGGRNSHTNIKHTHTDSRTHGHLQSIKMYLLSHTRTQIQRHRHTPQGYSSNLLR